MARITKTTLATILALISYTAQASLTDTIRVKFDDEGKKHGPCLNLSSNGDTLSYGQYAHGHKQGIWNYFTLRNRIVVPYSNGKITDSCVIVMPISECGTVVDSSRSSYSSIEVLNETKVMAIGNEENGVRTGRWWSFEKRMMAAGPYLDGQRHGEWVVYSGYYHQRGPYEHGIKHGWWHYSSYSCTFDGRRRQTGYYSDRFENGEVVERGKRRRDYIR